MKRSVLRRIAAVLAMVAGFGLATASAASAHTSIAPSSVVVVDNSNSGAQLADWWW